MKSLSLTTALALALLGGLQSAVSAAPLPAPEVIAPSDLPTVPVLRSDSAPVVVASGSYRAAPMPDDNASAPVVTESGEMRLRPTMFFQKNHYDGDGYAAGSDDHAKTVQPATGVAVDLPLN